MPVTSLRAQEAPPPTPAQLDSIRQRLEDAEAAIAALREQLATEASTALRSRSRVSLEFRGRALVHAIANSARVNNVDVPTFAVAPVPGESWTGFAMTIRQTTFGLAFTATDVLGGTFVGDLDADFFGGQQPSSGGRTFPLVRLRTARGLVEWRHGSLMIGQEQPLVAGLDPVSLASIGTPGFAASGNLWLWLPQVRAAVHTRGRVRVGLESAVLAPTSGDAAGPFDTDFDRAERTGTPFLQGLARLAWGEEEGTGFVAVGVHNGRVHDGAAVASPSRAVAAMALVPLGSRAHLRGEWFDGEGLRGLGGGAIGQAFGASGAPIATTGGWGQLNVQATPRLLVGAGAGFDDPDDADLGVSARRRNTTTEAHVHWRPSGPLVLGLEYRRVRTEYLVGTRANGHVNLAVGFEF